MEQETLKKFDVIKHIMKDVIESGNSCMRSSKPHKVGIIADFLEQNTFGWIHEALSSYHFSELIKKIKLINTSDKDTKKILKAMNSCTFYICMASGYNQETFPAMRRRLGFLFERKNLIIIIHNLENSSEQEKWRILHETRYCENVFLFSKKELGFNYLSRLVNDHAPGSTRRKKRKADITGPRAAITEPHSVYGTSPRNPISSDHHHQEPERMKYDNGKDKKKESSTLPVKNNVSSQVHGGERKSVFNLFRLNSTRKSTRKLISSDHNHQEPHNTGCRDRGGDAGAYSSQTRGIRHHRVGIFSRATDRDYSWLVKTLRSEEFSSLVANVKSSLISNSQEFQEFLDDINKCTFGILYHSRNRGTVNVTNVTNSLYDKELETLHMILGKENVLVVIDDLEDSGDDRKKGILQEQHDIAERAADLLLVSQDDKMDLRLLRKKTDQLKAFLRGADNGHGCHSSQNPENNKHRTYKMNEYLTAPLYQRPRSQSYSSQRLSFLDRTHPSLASSLQNIVSSATSPLPSLGPLTRGIRHHQVGIFSRATDRDYSWLVKTLRSEECSSLVANVKSCLISNSQEFQEFQDDINKCTFGILYHSRNRGRVKLTNVTDSLYDEELETLHMILGKENVLVIVDDLEDSGDYRKKGILQEQYDIEKRAADLLLVSQDDKMDPWLLRKKTDQLKTLLRGADHGIF